mgnify:CR=1 FL=1
MGRTILTGSHAGSSELSLTAAPYYHKTTGLGAVWSVPCQDDATSQSNLDTSARYSYLSVNSVVQKYPSGRILWGSPGDSATL